MIVHSMIQVIKADESDDFLTNFWNNLVRTMTIMSGGTRLPPPSVVSGTGRPLHYGNSKFQLRFYNYSQQASIKFLYDSGFEVGPEETLNTVVAISSALEYVIGREESLDIASWSIFYESTAKVYQDVSVDSMASVLGISEEEATDLFENRVEPKLDKIEESCL